MAKKEKEVVNKSQVVREYLESYPNARPGEVVAAMAARRIKITAAHVSVVKNRLRRAAKSVRAVAPADAAPLRVAAPNAAILREQPATAGRIITLEQVKKVAHTVKALGGFRRTTELLEIIGELGGVEKFREVAEAIRCPEAETSAC